MNDASSPRAAHQPAPPTAIQPDPVLYPEVAAAGGDLVSALQRAADGMHIDLGGVQGPESPTDPWRLIVASVDGERGSLTATLQKEERRFSARIWWTGVGEAARGSTADLETVVELAHAWRAGMKLSELQARWPSFEADELTLAHERGEAVAFKWQLTRDAPDRLIDHDIVEAAYAAPALRALYPMISHGSLGFSRCTHYPFSNDVPSLFPLGGGGWRVIGLVRQGGTPHQDAFTPEEAVEFVVAGLPEGCGPAVEGPAMLLPS
ncbi:MULTISPECIES: DUF6193 family natural product biosynthesis protein [unclassified Streptomyces]|uniref:DUF6193 family natural product biosynthesis protein n=1 Tax=unclassified Streptomyces TaxID=2593676 RepID=UPI002DD8D412|nr:DUF6193 family natural product biosynthesis protein [Streptomyces sp. NBC_00151]WRZ38049.1 DUF6193 family natural product biosynthesis protein [Streptomyces sp. NBC_00151]